MPYCSASLVKPCLVSLCLSNSWLYECMLTWQLSMIFLWLISLDCRLDIISCFPSSKAQFCLCQRNSSSSSCCFCFESCLLQFQIILYYYLFFCSQRKRGRLSTTLLSLKQQKLYLMQLFLSGQLFILVSTDWITFCYHYTIFRLIQPPYFLQLPTEMQNTKFSLESPPHTYNSRTKFIEQCPLTMLSLEQRSRFYLFLRTTMSSQHYLTLMETYRSTNTTLNIFLHLIVLEIIKAFRINQILRTIIENPTRTRVDSLEASRLINWDQKGL